MDPPAHPPEALARYVVETLLPRWHAAGVREDGSFHERLDPQLVPLDLGYRRLLVQCRQVFAFSAGARLGAPAWALECAVVGYRRLCADYRDDARGGWRFALGEGGPAPGEVRDLYAHGFVLLASASLLEAGGPGEAADVARDTLAFIEDRFAHPAGGFHEALDADLRPLVRVRRQNPHMHLLEGCLTMHGATGEAAYAELADRLLVLLRDRFYDPATSTLREFFDEELKVHPERGDAVEPGHHFEWIWLLHKRLEAGDPGPGGPTRDELLAVADGLLAFAVEHGLDALRGGIFDRVDPAGRPTLETKRIWPVCEATKAFAWAQRRHGAPYGAHLASAQALLFQRYLRGETGAWNESLDVDLVPVGGDLPASTLYHVVMAALELPAIAAGG